MCENENKKIQYSAVKKLDVFIYAFIVILTISLFLGFVILPRPTKNKGFRVEIDSNNVFEFLYDDNSYTVNSDFDVDVEPCQDGFTVKIIHNGEFNTLKINTSDKWVKVIDSDCSIKKDCVYFPPLTDDNGTIVCVPHRLVVIPLGSGFIPPVAG